jgi:threonine dehydrogenase-like Zn-dependent dehydrogenase
MEPETAVFLPNMETAVSFVMDSQPMIGEQTAVFGQGIVGLLTTSLLAQFPLSRLIALDAYPLRRQWSRQVGADASLDPTAPLPALAVDLALELSGNPAALDQAIASVGFNGRVLIGSWYGQKQAHLNLGGKFHRHQIRLISSQVSHIAPQWSGRWDKSRRWQLAAEQLARVQPQRLITHRFHIAQAAQAYQLLDQQPEETIQIILTYE